MAFDVGAGLAQVGQTVTQVAGAGMLEQQRATLEQQRLQLANDLAGQRESAGRQETAALSAAENRRHEAFQAGEGEKNRAAQLEAHKISAGASAASAATHLQAVREQIAAAEKLGDFHYNDDGTASMVNKRTGVATPVLGPDGQPRKFANPEKAKAQAELITTTKGQLDSTIRLYEADLKQAQAELTQAMKSPMAMVDPAKDPAVAEARKAVEAVRQKYEPRIATMTGRLDQIYSDLGVKAGLPTKGYDLNKYLKKPPDEAPPPRGLLDTPANY